jgi:hypothetical protein
MNIEENFKSRIAPTLADRSTMVNGTPPCQNIMFPNPHPFFSPFQEEQQRQGQSRRQQHPYQYQPIIHIPKKTTAATIGEVGASVDMMRAQLTELSRRMDAVESKFSEFKHSVSNEMYLLKSTLSEHATELLNVRDCVEDTRTHVKKTKELIERQDNCVDNLADTIRRQSNHLHKKQQQQKKIVASNVDLGIIRRRLSRVEDFTGEFYEQFENFKSVKEIITGLSDHINECDQDISSFILNRNEKLEYVNDCNTDAANGFNKNDEYDTNNLVIFMKEEHNKCDEDDFEYFEPIKKDYLPSFAQA